MAFIYFSSSSSGVILLNGDWWISATIAKSKDQYPNLSKIQNKVVVIMHKTENVELTVLCLITDGDKILLQNRTKEDWKGYALPGGHVEMGESFVDAVIREMKEETGLDIRKPELAGIKQFPIKDGKYENGRYIVFLFKTSEFTGNVTSSDEGCMEWVEVSKLSELETVDDLDELLEVINNSKLTEFQYLVEGDNWMVSIK